MPKNAHKYLAFPSVNFLKVCTVKKKELKGQVDIFTGANFKKFSPKETREIVEKKREISQKRSMGIKN